MRSPSMGQRNGTVRSQANSFAITGGGNGGFHYDESLGAAGYIRRFEIVSHLEDSRK